jgi:O-antigen ligase
MQNTLTKNIKYNSLCFSFFFMQYGLLLPFIAIWGSNIPIIFSSVVVLLVSFVLNARKFNSVFYLICFGVYLLLFVQYILFPGYEKGSADTIIYFSTIGVASIWVGSCVIDKEQTLKYMFVFSYINFFINVLIPFTSLYQSEHIDGMRYGYAILPSVIIGLYLFFNKKRRLVNFIMVSVLMIENFIFGTRGAFLSVALFIIFYLLFSDLKYKYLSAFSLVSISLVIYNYSIRFLEIVLNYLPFKTAALSRYSQYLDRSFAEASSGRDKIYEQAWDNILNAPWIGKGVGYNTETGYVHDFFLQILLEYGFIFGSLIVFLMFFLLKKVYDNRTDIYNTGIFIIVFSTVFGRLLVSSTYWQRPEFWLIISYMLLYKKRHKIGNL